MIQRPTIDRPARPAPRTSWVDALIDLVDRLPVPAWTAYLAAAGFSALLVHLLLWLTVGRAAGRFSLSVAVLASWSILCLGAFDYLNRVAVSTVSTLLPATDLSDEDAQLLTWKLTHLPSILAWLALPLAALWAVGVFAADPTFFGLVTGLGPIDAVLKLIGWINTVFMVLGTARALWFLAVVAGSHQLITRLNLFAPRPLFAFSALTVRIALVMIAMTYFFSLAFPTVTANPAAYIYIVAVVAPMSLAEFILPLMGIHREMVQEKERLQAEISARIDTVVDAIHGIMDGGSAPNLAEIQTQKELLAALFMEAEHVGKTPTWPWSPHTLGSLIAAVLLPLAVFVAQTLLGRLLRS